MIGPIDLLLQMRQMVRRVRVMNDQDVALPQAGEQLFKLNEGCGQPQCMRLREIDRRADSAGGLIQQHDGRGEVLRRRAACPDGTAQGDAVLRLHKSAC